MYTRVSLFIFYYDTAYKNKYYTLNKYMIKDKKFVKVNMGFHLKSVLYYWLALGIKNKCLYVKNEI